MTVATFRAFARQIVFYFILGLVVALTAALLLPHRARAQSLACGATAEADVVVILDLSGGTSLAQIQAQKAGATHLLQLFNGLTAKPRVAVATMNSICASAPECYNPALNEARIVAPLSTNYSAHLTALSPSGSIQGQGPGGSGLGGTNIQEAIEVAQAHLQSAGDPNHPNYIVVISDGDPTLPGYYLDFSCGNCFCTQAEDAGESAANAARAAGTSVFTIHVGATSCGGSQYLGQRIADDLALHFVSGGAFEGPFFEIAQAVQCSDGLSCTADSCDELTGQCEFTEISPCELCEGPGSPVGDPCDGPDADNCSTGVFECAIPGVLSCTDDPELDDHDGDGSWDCLDGCPNDPNKTAPGACGCGVADTDSDGDGIPNCNDGCPNDPNKTVPGVCGCGVADTDTDGDGTPNCNDGCPNDPSKVAPGQCGCGTPDTDSDGDGVANCNDLCPVDPLKTSPGACGCGTPDTDSDGDGTPNCNDACPSDPAKVAAGVCGCGVAETDSDGDGTPNCIDGCSLDPSKVAPGQCGCGVSDLDTDSDGVADCNDQCFTDPNKTAPGACGCGVADTDSDGDGTPNCNDSCPADPLKIAPGVCGCGVSDSDTNGDGVPDCSDLCPSDPDKVAPGVCGCGVPDSDVNANGTIDCQEDGGQCSTIDIRGYVSALQTIVGEQDVQLRRLLRSLILARNACPNPNAVTRFVKKSKRDGRKLKQVVESRIVLLPPEVLECPDGLGCSSTAVTLDVTGYSSESNSLGILARQALKLHRQCAQSGSCSEDSKSCRLRVLVRAKQAREEKRRIKELQSTTVTNLTSIPKTSFLCE